MISCRFKQALLTVGSLLVFVSGASAGSLSFSVDVPTLPKFSIAPGLYLSQELAPNLSLSASASAAVTPISSTDPWTFIGLSVGLNYSIPLLKNGESYLSLPVGVGGAYNLRENKGNPYIQFGLDGSYKFQYNARFFGSSYLQVAWDTVKGGALPNLGTTLGFQYDVSNDFNTYYVLETGTNFGVGGDPAFRYNARITGEYRLFPGFKIGVRAGVRNEALTPVYPYLTFFLRYTLSF